VLAEGKLQGQAATLDCNGQLGCTGGRVGWGWDAV
jgi:hypothetical protein